MKKSWRSNAAVNQVPLKGNIRIAYHRLQNHYIYFRPNITRKIWRGLFIFAENGRFTRPDCYKHR